MANAFRDKLYIWHMPNKSDRQIVHEWLDDIPSIGHIGLKLNVFPPGDGFFIKTCPECKTKTKLDQYHYGTSDNNIDEWYSGTCQCGKLLSHEVNLDDSLPWIVGHNALLVGRNVSRSPAIKFERTYVKDDFALSLLANRPCYSVPLPKTSMFQRQLQRYLNEQLTIVR